MMEKVIFDGYLVKSAKTGKFVGKLMPSRDGCLHVILNNRTHQYAYYGTMDDTGKFYPFCQNTSACGSTCFDAHNPACRYNRKLNANSGYYVDTSAIASVY